MSAENLSQQDERIRAESLATKLMKKPELGAIGGVVLVTLFFLATADSAMFTLSGIMNFMTPAAQLGILGIAAAMLMIGGEFDLSIGSMVAFAGMVFGVFTVNLGLPLIFAIPLTMAFAALIGALNGAIVLRTGLPSFIVTLAGLFILRGASLVGLKLFTGGSTQLRGVRDAVEGDFLAPLFSGDAFTGLFGWLASIGVIDSFKSGAPKVPGIPVEILWFVVIALVATYILVRTPVGNWVFATGGDTNAAKNSGVPVRGVKISLFMLTACAASLVAIITVIDAGSTDARRGFMKEFEAIITAVIGGCLLTGGYGSAIGAFFGAIIFGMVTIGLTYTDFDQDWFQIFLGGMLLLAVVFNNVIRKRVTGER
ncbi:ABC transporter permease [Paracoccus homiensis]|uniref:Xylose transport system permease protein XylH n=1 Tax=Paracoccus homiensis TaxID=364199 RepID=A0A1I0HXJ3_9RHOB|nr:ABC transporter permease [Paracoccus homiensis]SET88989.1 monosaccharide ABC transporter membrane protein, CUT2 family [Paracoccus homiensis]